MTATRFDAAASQWDANPARVALAGAVLDAIQRAVTLAPNMDVMDFGAGTGLISLGLAPHVRTVTAIDTSTEMLKILQGKLSQAGLSNVETRHLNLETEIPAAGEFDLIVSSMALHHVRDTAALLARFGHMLKPGGRVALADLEQEDGSFHPDPAGVYHHGFARTALERTLEQAGFTGILFQQAHVMSRPAPDGRLREYGILLVTASRPA